MSLHQRRQPSPTHTILKRTDMLVRDDNKRRDSDEDTYYENRVEHDQKLDDSPEPSYIPSSSSSLNQPVTMSSIAGFSSSSQLPPILESTSSSPVAVASSLWSPASTLSVRAPTTSLAAAVTISSTKTAMVTSATSDVTWATSRTYPSTLSTRIAALQPASTPMAFPSGVGGSAMANDPPRVPGHRGPVTGLATGAKAALITTFVLGGIALIVGAIWYFRRRRLLAEREKRHADDAFNPGNVGSLTLPETTHVTAGSDTSPNSLFESPQYISRKPVGSGQSTSRSASRTHHFFPSRIATPEPTPNPFADAPRNKAYDQLRGRPRSTTLTDRGSWVENPFKDPASDRFDPFGELQRKAKDERRKYVEELRKEAEKKRRLMERGDDQKEMK